MLHADKNHPVWDMIHKYNNRFAEEYMIGTMCVSSDITGMSYSRFCKKL